MLERVGKLEDRVDQLEALENVVRQHRQALKLERKAASGRAWGQCDELLARAIQLKERARDSMVTGSEESISMAAAGRGPSRERKK